MLKYFLLCIIVLLSGCTQLNFASKSFGIESYNSSQVVQVTPTGANIGPVSLSPVMHLEGNLQKYNR
jgi:hypothetical protein